MGFPLEDLKRTLGQAVTNWPATCTSKPSGAQDSGCLGWNPASAGGTLLDGDGNYIYLAGLVSE